MEGRRENEKQEYHHKRKEAHKIIRNRKKLYIKNVIESIEEDQKHKYRKMHHTINQFKKFININLTRLGTKKN
jgi:hypothetical protein